MLIAVLLLGLLLTGCNPDGTGDGSGNNTDGAGGGVTETKNLIFSIDVMPNIVCNDTADISEAISDLQSAVFGVTYRTPMVVSEDETAPHEIVVGKTSRPISGVAYRLLERLDVEGDEVSYLIYSDGSSLAIAYDEDRYHINAAVVRAVEYLDEYFDGKSEVAIKKGVLKTVTFDALEYQQELDDEQTELQWAVFEQKANELGGDGAAIVAAVKEYYAKVCTDDIVSWLANLYDPAIGGFYFSNGSRDTPGFLPDAESTSQAIGELQGSGMLEKFKGENRYIAGLPEWFRNQVVAFIKGLQDPVTGYFYHPQWTKEEVNAHLSRRARDMTKSCSLLKNLGWAPTYDTPSGTKGDGVTVEEFVEGRVMDFKATSPTALTTYLSWSSESLAVSKVIPTAAVAVPDHLLNDKTFKAYLDEQAALNAAGKRSFYAIGNEIGSQVSEIKNRDKTLAAEGAEYSLGDILIAWYTEHQDKETGLWDKGINYDATNALLKIVGTFDSFGYIFPNADLALQSCLIMATSSDEAKTVCYVYNIWFSIEELITSVNKYSSSEADKEYANSVRKIILEMAPEAIKISMEKQLRFKQADGSFSFTAEGNCITSQGLRVGVPGEGDGDVNATTICLAGTISRCLRTMGLEPYAPGFWTEADRLRFVAILEELGPVIKDDVDVPIDYDEFDDEPINNPPQNVTCDNLKSGILEVVEDPDGESGDRALKFVNNAGDYEAVQISSQSGALNATCFVFETDFYIESGSEKATFTQFYLQDAVYMINVTEENGRFKLVETSASSWSLSKQQDLGVRLDFGQWYNIKIEYFVGDHDTVRIKVYIDGELIAITDNYFDKSGDKLTGKGTPKDRMDFVNIIGLTNSAVTMYIDNVACYKTSDIYKPLSANEKQPAINVDPPEKEFLMYDFDGESIPEDFTVSANGASVEHVSADGNGALKVGATAKDADPSNITLPINLRYGKARCVVLDTEITVSSDATGTLQRIWFAENELGTNPLACFDLAVKKIDGVSRVVLVEAPGGKPGAVVDGTAMPLGESFKLRMEYYEQEATTLFYVNERLVGLSNASCSNARKYSAKALVMTGVAGAAGSVTFDNFVFEKDHLSFDTSASGGVEETVHGFDTLPEGAEISGGASVSDGVARLPESGSLIKLPILGREDVHTSVSAVTDVIWRSGNGSYLITLWDKDDKEILAIEIVVNTDGVEFFEYYAGGRGVSLGSVALRNYDFKLRLEYYYKQSTLNAFVESEAAAATSLTWLYDRDGLIPEYLTVKNMGGGSIELDNAKIERKLALYTQIKPIALPSRPAVKTEQTYEDVILGNLPTNITSSLAIGAEVAVKGMMTELGATKALSFSSVSGANDSVTIEMAPESKLDGAVATVLETDITIISNNPDKAGIEIYFRNSSNNNANKFIIYSLNDSAITVSDYLSAKGTTSYSATWPVKDKETFHLRLEYVVRDGDMRINFFINGSFVGKSTVFVPTDKPFDADDIVKAYFYTHGAFCGTVLFDNTKFYQTNDPTYVPSRDPGENFMKGGLTFEGMATIWAGIDKGGTSNELPLDDKLIVRNTSNMATKFDTANPYIDLFTDDLGMGAVFGKENNDKMGEMYLKNLGGAGNCYVFDAQMQLGEVEGLQGNGEKWILRLAFADGYRNTRNVAMPSLVSPFDILANDDGSFTIGNKTVSGEDWINLTLEYYPDDYALVAYVDGEVVAVQRVEGKLEDFKRVSLFLREEAAKAAIKLDNMSAYVKEKAFVETLPEDTKDALAEILPVKGGANGIVVLIHDDGDLESCSNLDKLYLKHGLVGDVAMIANKVYDKSTGKAKDNVSDWQKLLDTDRWQVVNHSYSHSVYGTDTNGEFKVDEEKLIEEIITSGDMLRAVFPGEKVLAYAYPGFGALNSTYGDKLYDMAREIIRQYYVAAREMGGGSVELGDEIWEFLSSESMATNRVSGTIDRINEAADGGMAVLFTHKVGDGGDITVAAMDQILTALAAKVASGEIWNTHLADAALYRREAESAKVSSKVIDGRIVITLTDDLDNSIYDYALTVKVKVDGWAAAKITQGGKLSYAVAKDGYILADITPDAGDAVIEQIALADVPTVQPDTPKPSPDFNFGGNTPTPPTPPAGDDEDDDDPETPQPTPPTGGTFDDIGEIPENPDNGDTSDSDGWT